MVAKGKKLNSLYVMQATLRKGEVNAIQKDVNFDIWHKRLGHINEKGLHLSYKV